MPEPRKATRRWRRRLRPESVASVVLAGLLAAVVLGLAVLLLMRWSRG